MKSNSGSRKLKKSNPSTLISFEDVTSLSKLLEAWNSSAWKSRGYLLKSLSLLATCPCGRLPEDGELSPGEDRCLRLTATFLTPQSYLPTIPHTSSVIGPREPFRLEILEERKQRR